MAFLFPRASRLALPSCIALPSHNNSNRSVVINTSETLLVDRVSATYMELPPAVDGDGYADLRNPKSWEQLGGAAACVLCAALAAGLTVGLMSLDPLELEVKRRVGTAEERKYAERICPLISRHHRLLVTLLLFNSLANEALPIFLAELVPSYVAVLLSVTAILIFGEIIPSALFTGPQQLVMASRLSGFVYLLMGLFYPIAGPLAWCLDRWLGGHHTFKRYTREEVRTHRPHSRGGGGREARRGEQ